MEGSRVCQGGLYRSHVVLLLGVSFGAASTCRQNDANHRRGASE